MKFVSLKKRLNLCKKKNQTNSKTYKNIPKKKNAKKLKI